MAFLVNAILPSKWKLQWFKKPYLNLKPVRCKDTWYPETIFGPWISLPVYTTPCLPALAFGYTPRNKLLVANCSGPCAVSNTDDRIRKWEILMLWYHLQHRVVPASLTSAGTNIKPKGTRIEVLRWQTSCSQEVCSVIHIRLVDY